MIINNVIVLIGMFYFGFFSDYVVILVFPEEL